MSGLPLWGSSSIVCHEILGDTQSRERSLARSWDYTYGPIYSGGTAPAASVEATINHKKFEWRQTAMLKSLPLSTSLRELKSERDILGQSTELGARFGGGSKSQSGESVGASGSTPHSRTSGTTHGVRRRHRTVKLAPLDHPAPFQPGSSARALGSAFDAASSTEYPWEYRRGAGRDSLPATPPTPQAWLDNRRRVPGTGLPYTMKTSASLPTHVRRLGRDKAHSVNTAYA